MSQPDELEGSPEPHDSPYTEWSEPMTPIFSHDFSAPSMQKEKTSTGPFQDAGKRPALSFGFSTPHVPPSTSAQGLSKELTSFGDSSSVGRKTVFGTTSSFGVSTFGGKPYLGASSFFPADRAAIPSPSFPALLSPPAQDPELSGDDSLSKAIRRFTQKRPAVIGVQEIAADGMIAKYLGVPDGGPIIKALAADLVVVQQKHPATMDFLRYVFDQVSSNASARAPPRAHLTRELSRHSQAELELKELLNEKFREFEWGEDLCDYIMRMIIFGASPREIRHAVKTYIEQMHGHNNVSADEVEGLVEWIRGDAADLVQEVRFTGTALDFFRPSSRHDRRFSKMATGDKRARSGCSEEFAKDEAMCMCNEKKKKKTASSVSDLKAERAEVHAAVDGTKQNVPKGEKLEEQKFRLMDLPAEMRMWVYKAALTPSGYISLRSCGHHIPAGVFPPVATSIYSISKTINKEAEGLLLDNTIIVNGCLESGSRPAIHRAQLPERILALIQSLVIVLDFTRVINVASRLADWRVAQGLTGLTKLRICGIATKDPGQQLSEHMANYLRVIMERIPAECEVSFGEEDGGNEVREHMADMVQKIRQVPVYGSNLLEYAYAMGSVRLESVWMDIEGDAKRGCKSGFKEDFRFEERRAKGELDEHFRQLRERQEEMRRDEREEAMRTD